MKCVHCREGRGKHKVCMRLFADASIKTDMIISSHVVRAIETANMIASALNYPEDNIKIDSQIYYSGVNSLFNQFYDISDFVRSVIDHWT